MTDSRAAFRDGKITVTGSMAVGMLLRDVSRGVVYTEKNVRFEYGLSRGAQENSLRPECRVAVRSCGYTVTGDNRLEIQAELCLHCALFEDISARAVSAVELDESRPKPEENRPAAVLCFAEAGEELWDIAREYNSSVESIRLDNGLDSDVVDESRLLIVTA